MWRKDAARHASTSTMKSRLSRKLFKAGIADQREARVCSMRLVALITDYSVVHCILLLLYFYNDSAITIINIWTVYLIVAYKN